MNKLWTREFHRSYYYSNVWNETYWYGTKVLQCPLDMWILQEIIYETKPDFIIETGTYNGGSAYFFAHMLDLIGKGQILTIDVRDVEVPSHPRITKIVGDSTSKKMIKEIKGIIGDEKTMVFLDSLHNTEHVSKELKAYSPLVSKGYYLVVADSNVNGHPILLANREGDKTGGPMESLKKFMKNNTEFVIDRSKEKFFLTFFPSGYLRRVKDAKEEVTG